MCLCNSFPWPYIYICRHIFCSSRPLSLSLSRSYFLYTGLYRFMSPYIYICIYTYIVHSILSSCLRMYVWAELSLRGLDAAEQQNSCAISVHTSGSLSTFHGGWRQGLVCGHNRRNLSSLACYCMHWTWGFHSTSYSSCKCNPQMPGVTPGRALRGVAQSIGSGAMAWDRSCENILLYIVVGCIHACCQRTGLAQSQFTRYIFWSGEHDYNFESL